MPRQVNLNISLVKARLDILNGKMIIKRIIICHPEFDIAGKLL